MADYHHFLALLFLLVLLAPGLIVGSIVAFKVRSGWPLPGAVVGSMAGAMVIPFTAGIISNFLVPLLKPILGSWLNVIDFQSGGGSLGSAIVALIFHIPIMVFVGLVGGAILTGMLWIARHRVHQRGSQLSLGYMVVSMIGSAIAGGLLSLILMLLLTLLAGIGGWFISILPIPNDYKTLIALISMGLSILAGGTLGGFLSAIGGIRLATFLI